MMEVLNTEENRQSPHPESKLNSPPDSGRINAGFYALIDAVSDYVNVDIIFKSEEVAIRLGRTGFTVERSLNGLYSAINTFYEMELISEKYKNNLIRKCEN